MNGSDGKKGLSPGLLALVVMVALFWGFSFVAIDLSLEVYAPIQLLALRWLLAALLFLALILSGKLRLSFTGKAKKWILLTAIAQPCLYPICETYGVQFTSPSLTSIFIATIPCVTLIEGMLLFHRRTSPRGILGILLAFAGVVVCTVFAPDFSAEGKFFGYLILLLGIPIGAIYGHFSHRAGEEYAPLAVTAVMAFLAVPWFTGLNFALGYGFATYTLLFQQWQLLLCVLFLGACCSFLCYFAYNKVLQGAQDPALVTNVTAGSVTSVGVLAGILVAGDTAGWYTAVGLVLTLSGVVLSSREA